MDDESQIADQRLILRLTNSHESSLIFVLEPWGEEYEFPAGATFEVVARSPAGDTLEVATDKDSVTVWAWSGSTVAVFHAGECITDTSDLRVPSVPAGMSIRGFLGMVMGNGEKPSGE